MLIYLFLFTDYFQNFHNGKVVSHSACDYKQVPNTVHKFPFNEVKNTTDRIEKSAAEQKPNCVVACVIPNIPDQKQ